MDAHHPLRSHLRHWSAKSASAPLPRPKPAFQQRGNVRLPPGFRLFPPALQDKFFRLRPCVRRSKTVARAEGVQWVFPYRTRCHLREFPYPDRRKTQGSSVPQAEFPVHSSLGRYAHQRGRAQSELPVRWYLQPPSLNFAALVCR